MIDSLTFSLVRATKPFAQQKKTKKKKTRVEETRSKSSSRSSAATENRVNLQIFSQNCNENATHFFKHTPLTIGIFAEKSESVGCVGCSRSQGVERGNVIRLKDAERARYCFRCNMVEI